jgi:hypothetical protein
VSHHKATEDDYYFDYEYGVGGLRHRSRTDVSVDQKAYYRTQIGDLLPIYYLPSDPSVSSNDPQGWLDNSRAVLTAGAIFIGFGSIALGAAGILARGIRAA